jgi:hypothetical protein
MASPISPPLIHAQQDAPRKLMMLVTWFGPGAIPLPADPNLKPTLVTVYDKGMRPVAQFSQAGTGLSVSFILFENRSGKATPQGCREDVIAPILANDSQAASKRVDGEVKGPTGDTIATAAFQVDMSVAGLPTQRNLFGFAGNAKTCAEIHISSIGKAPHGADPMAAVLSGFTPDLDYQPNAGDYFRLASVLFKNAPGLAAPYYKAALDTIPAGAPYTTPRRVTTDQLVMALGMSGDIKNSRAVAESATAHDPDYPLNYYNLACADAEQGNAADARTHLQLAFDHRANVLKGESMPDPTKDDSILKLKKDKAFWDFVLALPKN